MTDLPGYVWTVVFVGMVGIPASTCLVLYRGARRLRLDRRATLTVTGGAAIILGGWLAVSALLAHAGVYHPQLGLTPPWLAIAFATALTTLLASTRIPLVARVLAEEGTEARLALPHVLRIAGAAFLIVMALGDLPAVFALPAGLGDITVGVAAPFVARRLAQGTGRRAAVWFNLLGLVDLVVAVGIGTTVGYRLVNITPHADALSVLPLALIPTTAVPLALTLHIVSLRRLATTRRTATPRTEDLVPASK